MESRELDEGFERPCLVCGDLTRNVELALMQAVCPGQCTSVVYLREDQ